MADIRVNVDEITIAVIAGHRRLEVSLSVYGKAKARDQSGNEFWITRSKDGTLTKVDE